MEKMGKEMRDKVESKVGVETVAIQAKKRGKFDEKKGDQKKDAMTMGGNLLGISTRAMPQWR